MPISTTARKTRQHTPVRLTHHGQRGTPIDYARINRAALTSLPALLERWLPDGRREGSEWTARNPRRVDHHLGSFKVNMRTGWWADFATGDKGGDVISLAAYLFGLSQSEARQIARMLGLGAGGQHYG